MNCWIGWSNRLDIGDIIVTSVLLKIPVNELNIPDRYKVSTVHNENIFWRNPLNKKITQWKIFFLVKSLIDAADESLIDVASTHDVVTKEFLKHICKLKIIVFFLDFLVGVF